MERMLRRLSVLSLGVMSFTAASCSGGGGGGGGSGGPTLALSTVTAALTFPIFLTASSNRPDRVYVCQKGGEIVIIESGSVLPTPFLDLSALVSTGEEQGLLGLAFDPDYIITGRFYVSYTDLLGRSVFARYLVSGFDPDQADAGSAEILFTVDQPDADHNGGMIAFGPDGYLWIALGDGNGSIGGDPLGTAQSLTDRLGSILRIDVSTVNGYAIPPDNPYVADGNVPDKENYCLGLRNPWRFSFDRQTGELYLADVGQDEVEEVDALAAAAVAGANFGWNIAEGDQCFLPAIGCSTVGQVIPVHTYLHTGGRCSITGGYVYRGSAIPSLQGTYFYADFCTGGVSSFVLAGGLATDHRDWPTLDPNSEVTSFGEDAAGELYVLTSGGGVYQIVEN